MESKNLITVGFTRNESIILSPLFRRLFLFKNIITNTNVFELKNQICSESLIVCNGSSDFLEMDAANIFAKECGAKITACIFTDIVKETSLTFAQQNNVQLIIGDLESEDEINDCIQAVRDERHYISKNLFSSKNIKLDSFEQYFNTLSVRERIACIGMLQGYRHDEIASHLGVSKSTVDTYCSKVLNKFGLASIAELVQFFAFKNL